MKSAACDGIDNAGKEAAYTPQQCILFQLILSSDAILDQQARYYFAGCALW